MTTLGHERRMTHRQAAQERSSVRTPNYTLRTLTVVALTGVGLAAGFGIANEVGAPTPIGVATGDVVPGGGPQQAIEEATIAFEQTHSGVHINPQQFVTEGADVEQQFKTIFPHKDVSTGTKITVTVSNKPFWGQTIDATLDPSSVH